MAKERLDLEEGEEDSERNALNEEISQELDIPGEEVAGSAIELEDGGVIFNLANTKGPLEDEEHFANLAEELDETVLKRLAIRFCELISIDKEARKERDEQHELGLLKSGLGQEAPGGNPAVGGNKLTSPLLSTAVIEFAAVAAKEITPPGDLVKTQIKGTKQEKSVLDQAERKADFMNWQLNEQICEYRDEMETSFTQLPFEGSSYIKWWWDSSLKRPRMEWLGADKVILPFAANSFYTASRVTEVEEITADELSVRFDQGLYRDILSMDDELFTERSALTEIEQGEVQDAANKIEGKEFPNRNIDAIRKIFHVYCWLRLEEDPKTKGERAPYLLVIDEELRDVYALYRNWASGDEDRMKLDWIVEQKFLPFRGALGLSLTQVIGSLSSTATGSLRALLDAAFNSNSQTMVMLKSGTTGESLQIEPNQIAEIDNASAEDVRRLIMPLPFSPPNQTLFELLNWVTTQAKSVVQVTVDETPESGGANVPVGTTMARIESGMKVFSSIHARLHRAQAKSLEILSRVNYWYLEEMNVESCGVEIEVRDFATTSLVRPVSDANIFCELQRVSQAQAVLQLSQTAKDPNLYDERELHKRVLDAMKIPYADQVIKQEEGIVESNAALENISMSMGRAVAATMSNDHVAHIITHLLYAEDPNYGANPLIASSFCPLLMEHIKQHLTLHYIQSMIDQIKHDDSGGEDIFQLHREGKPLSNMEQQALALVATKVREANAPKLAEFLPKIQALQDKVTKAMKAKQENALMNDPSAAALIQIEKNKGQIETQRLQMEFQAKQKEQQDKYQAEIDKLLAQIDQLQHQTDTDQEKELTKAATAVGIASLNNEAKIAVEQLKIGAQQTAQQMELEHAENMAGQAAAQSAYEQITGHEMEMAKQQDSQQAAASAAQAEAGNKQALQDDQHAQELVQSLGGAQDQQAAAAQENLVAQTPGSAPDTEPSGAASGGLADKVMEQSLGGGNLPQAAVAHQLMAKQNNRPKGK